MTYEAKTFSISELEGISKESVDQHIVLYQGYVKNFNSMAELADQLRQADAQKNALAIGELMRRRSFEFGGMRLHEYYFPQLEGGAVALDAGSALGSALSAQYGEAAGVEKEMRALASLRGPGWSILYWDPGARQFLVGFSEEQHQGHFATLPIIIALDVWEHAYVLDYGASGKGSYVDAFFANLNWGVAEKRFAALA